MMVIWENNLDDPELPPAQSFAVVGPMPERLRLAFGRQQQAANEENPPPTDEEIERADGAR